MLAALTNVASTGLLPAGMRQVWSYWRAGGWLMVPLAGVAYLILWRYFTLRSRLVRALSAPEGCIQRLERRLADDVADPRTAHWLSGLPGAVPRLSRHVLARVSAGMPFREAFEQCREGELGTYAHGFCVLAAMVVAAPLLGLLGTVLGMIETFDAVALRSGETAEMVAGGISQALITTQVGLVAALPGTFGLAHLQRLLQRLRNDIDRCGSHLYVIFAPPQCARPLPVRPAAQPPQDHASPGAVGCAGEDGGRRR